MKKTLFFLIIIITSFLAGCGKTSKKVYNEIGEGKKFKIEGNISNGAGRKMFLQIISTDPKKAEDSVIIDSKGDFKLQSNTNYPTLYILRTDSGPFLTLCIKGGEKIRVKADYNDHTNYSISGSEESEQIHELGQKTKDVLTKVSQLVQMSQDSVNSPEFATIKSKLTGDFDKLMNGLRSYSKEFIKRNSTSLVCLLALKNQVGPQMHVLHPLYDKELFIQVDSVLTSIYPKSDLVLSFHNELSAYLSQVEVNKPAQSFLSIGQTAPDISLPSPEGKIIKLSSLKGKFVLLDFWAAWCRPCRAENPNLVLNYQKYHAKGFEIYQVSLDRNKIKWEQSVANIPWICVRDENGPNTTSATTYNISSIPTTFLMNKQGTIIARSLEFNELEKEIEKSL